MTNNFSGFPNMLRYARPPVLSLGSVFIAQCLPRCPVWHVEVLWRRIFVPTAAGPDILGSSVLFFFCYSHLIVCEWTFYPLCDLSSFLIYFFHWICDTDLEMVALFIFLTTQLTELLYCWLCSLPEAKCILINHQFINAKSVTQLLCQIQRSPCICAGLTIFVLQFLLRFVSLITVR